MTPRNDIDVLGLGAVAVDDLLYVDEYPPAERKVRVRHRERQSGGLTGTALVAAARMGARCAYAGVIGDDELSQFVTARFEQEGIDPRYGVRRPDARPAHSTIIVDQNRNTRTVFASLEGAIGADPRLPEADVIRAASVLLIDHHGVEGALRAVRIAREAGVAVVADFERDPGPPFAELLALVDHLVVSERFARELAGEPNVPVAAITRKLLDRQREAVVITCGELGCWYASEADGGQPRPFSAFPINVVDTTGCGDVFHGVYAAALASGDALDRRVALSTAAAALKATRRGGQAGIPSRSTIEEFLRARA
ncbi:MAG: PfkB family carbohydrate kinase [Planctomycetota bacterium]|jgi:sugar/nucleoside kinase (ribokinase family)